MEHGFIKVTAIEARRGAKALNKAASARVQNDQHPEVLAATRMVKAFGLIPDNQYVEVGITSPLIDFIRPAHLPQLNEQGHPVAKKV